MKKRTLRFSTKILLTILPALILVLLALAGFIYQGLYRTIIAGFENKLNVLGLLNSSLIDADEHQALKDYRQETAFALDPATRRLYLGYATGDLIRQVDLTHEQFLPQVLTNLPGIAHLAFNPRDNQLLAVPFQRAEIQVFSLDQSSLVTTIETPFEPEGIALQDGRIFALVAGKLFVTSLATNQTWEEIGSLPIETAWGLTSDSPAWLAAVDIQQGAILRFCLTNLNQQDLIAVKDERQQKPLRHLPLRGIAPHGLGYVCGSPSGLVLIDAATGCLQPLSLVADPQQQLRELYAKYVAVLVRVHQAAGLTYIPSSTISDDLKTLVYALDSATDEYHSLVGYPDPTELEEGIIDSWTKNRPYNSGVTSWGDYGLMKSAYYPIVTKKNRVAGLLAVDLNVSIISEKTLSAVKRVIFSGGLTLILGIILALSVARRIVRPIRVFKEFALRVAAGDYGKEIQVFGNDELSQLMRDYNQMSLRVNETLDSLQMGSWSLEEERRAGEYLEFLARNSGPERIELPNLKLGRRPQAGIPVIQCASGIYFIVGLDSPELSVAVYDYFSKQTINDQADFVERLARLGLEYRSLLRLDPAQKTIAWISREPCLLGVQERPGGEFNELLLKDAGVLPLKAGLGLNLSGGLSQTSENFDLWVVVNDEP